MAELIILAGGLGTRLRSKVRDIPKPMALVRGKPFLGYILNYFLSQKAKHFIISIGYKGQKIQEFFGNSYKGIPISYAIESEPLGTGGALLAAKSLLKSDSPFVLVNGDTFFEVNLRSLLKFHQQRESDMTIAIFSATQADRFGLLSIGENSQITFFESKKAPIGGYANGGVYIISHSLFSYLIKIKTPFSLEDELMESFRLQGKKLFGLEQKGKFIDIGLPEDYELAQGLSWW